MVLFEKHLGELMALSAAFCWALSTVMYRPIGYRLSAGVMNLLKNLIASLLLVLMIGAGWLFAGKSFGSMDGKTFVLLAISGVIGIGLGDTFFFASLRQLGARRAMLMATLGPPLTALIGLYYPGEQLQWLAWVGIILTMAGVAWVITERAEIKGPAQTEHHTGRGVMWGIAFSICAALAATVSRDAMVGTEARADVAALIRIMSGVLTVCLLLPVIMRMDAKAKVQRPKMTLPGWGLFVVAVFFGTFLGIWLYQIAIDHTMAGIAQTLVTTSTLFVLPIAAVMGERVTWRAMVGAVVAVLGIVLLIQFTGGESVAG